MHPNIQSIAVFIQSLSCVRLFVTPWTAARQASLSVTTSWSLLKFMSIELVMPSNHLLLYCPLLLLPSIFPSIRIFSKESVLRIRWLKYESFQWIFRVDFLQNGLVGSPCSPRDSQESSPALQFKSINSSMLAQPYLWSSSHICTWLLEKPQLWLYRPLSAKWCLWFLIHHLGLS